jgi:uncharacterized protein YbbC (DUF1343 family)
MDQDAARGTPHSTAGQAAGQAVPLCVGIGLERCVEDPPDILCGGNFGLLMNQASVDRQFRYAHQRLATRLPGRLKALFGPQHGLWSEQQDNMVETAHGHDLSFDVPVYSLYADRRKPTPDMLQGLDCLVIDLQNVGTRVYTFTWTVAYCLEACAAARVPALVLDRPNPMGGQAVEGPLLDRDMTSFVGRYPIPMRHGLTMAEMAHYLNRSMALGADLQIVPMIDWRRAMHWPETGRTWVGPSPNLPRIEGVDVYPGQVLLEGTNLSEGRGTTTPFEVFGAPFIDPDRLLDALTAYHIEGVVMRPYRFVPTFQKWHGQSCRGLFLHVVDRQRFAAYRTTLALLACVKRLWPEAFQWLEPPYEYETRARPIDILAGSRAVRETIDAGATPEQIDALAAADAHGWWQAVEGSLIYGA